MDKVYTLTMKVRYEGDTLMGIYKTRESAEDAAASYMKTSIFSWTPNNLTGKLPLIWYSDHDADIWLCDEEVMP